MITLNLTPDEFDELVYAARDAGIRFKRMRTMWLKDETLYAHWNLEELDEKISHYERLEKQLTDLYYLQTTESWY